MSDWTTAELAAGLANNGQAAALQLQCSELTMYAHSPDCRDTTVCVAEKQAGHVMCRGTPQLLRVMRGSSGRCM